jgi:hypothetical protein
VTRSPIIVCVLPAPARARAARRRRRAQHSKRRDERASATAHGATAARAPPRPRGALVTGRSVRKHGRVIAGEDRLDLGAGGLLVDLLLRGIRVEHAVERVLLILGRAVPDLARPAHGLADVHVLVARRIKAQDLVVNDPDQRALRAVLLSDREWTDAHANHDAARRERSRHARPARGRRGLRSLRSFHHRTI